MSNTVENSLTNLIKALKNNYENPNSDAKLFSEFMKKYPLSDEVIDNICELYSVHHNAK